MSIKNKIIRDPIHGNIKCQGIFFDLIEAPEIQRLYDVKQLGFAHLVYPGAHHTRLEHSLGTYHLAAFVANKLKLNVEEKKIISCAALLHDIGHGPFSHTLESILRDILKIDHIDLTEKLILGKYSIFDEYEKKIVDSNSVYEILKKYDIDNRLISNIIKGKLKDKYYLSQILNSAIDVDQLDYLMRDAYYTGVAYGMIDFERFLQTLILFDNKIALEKKGVGVVENILMARALMYSSVYFHKTVRIAELMLSKAIDIIPKKDPLVFFKMTDSEIINELKKKGPYQKEIATRLKFRKLFKQAFSISGKGLDASYSSEIKKLEDAEYRRQKEEHIEDKLKIPKGHIIIDIPSKELHQAEPRIDLIDIPIIDKNEVKPLEFFTPVANAIKMRLIPDWSLMIITDEKYKKIVTNKVKKLIFN